jgi:hypothetical protein
MLQVFEIAVTRDYLMAERQALLLRLEAIEKLLDISPRTSEIRKAAKEVYKEKGHNNAGNVDGI